MISTLFAAIPCLYLAEENPARTGSRWLAVLPGTALRMAAQALLQAGYHLEDVSGLHAQEAAVSAYHFDHFDTPGRISLLVTAPYSHPHFPSIASIYEGAEWHERETQDFFGFTYTDNPNGIPLLLAHDMADLHPLVKVAQDRKPLHVLFNVSGRGSVVRHKAADFTLLDAPAAKASTASPE